MVGLHGGAVERVDLHAATAELKLVPESLLHGVSRLFLD
jgi:hypothetical protein